MADPATAEDILHDVFVKFQGHFHDFQDPVKIPGWLFRVARNAIVDHYRTRKPTSELSDSLPMDPNFIDSPETDELHAMFRQLIARLPESYREAIQLTEFEGLSQAEFARQKGISLSGAKSRIQRAREQLKEMLFEFCRREFRHTPGCSPCPHGLIPSITAMKLAHNPPRRKKSAI